MNRKAQFLQYYLDQLVKSDLVEWVETALSSTPSDEYKTARGFQNLIGATNSGPRTRAGEAFKLGLLFGRLARQQTDPKHQVPSGWQNVIDGKPILTTAGNYGYIIGKLILQKGTNNRYEDALDCLAILTILHIGFEYNGRWYSTLALFEFVRQKLELELKQTLSHTQLRFLIGALVNTVESEKISTLISAYSEEVGLDSLWFKVDSQLTKVALKDFGDENKLKDIGSNSIKKAKAALYWAQPRGIYTRAKRASCGDFLTAFTDYDRKLIQQGRPNILTPVYESQSLSQKNIDLVVYANKNFAVDEELNSSWKKLDSTIMRIVRAAVASTDYKSAPTIWKNSLRRIPSINTKPSSKVPPLEHARKAPPEKIGEKNQEEFEPAAPPLSPSEAEVERDPGDVEYIEGYWLNIEAYLKDDFENIIQDTPSGGGEQKKKIGKKSARKGKKTDYLAKGKRDKKLGDAGEEFVVHYEKAKLIKLDRPDLAERVVWASEEIGDGLGYDISSFDSEGEPIQIEVKTTRSGLKSPFYISPTELEASEDFAKGYRLYRVFNYGSEPKIFILTGALTPQLDLVATAYRASVL